MKKKSTKCLQGKGPVIETVYERTVSLYKSAKDKSPLVSISCDGGCRVSVLKLALILACAVFALALTVMLIKRAVEKSRTKKPDSAKKPLPETDEGVWYYDDEGHLVWQRDPNEELPF